MTSIEWLDEQITICFENYSGTTLSQRIYDKIEQAKEMHKQEMKNAWKDGKGTLFSFSENKTSEQYYQETFVSKGSDDHIVDTNEMVEDDIEKLAMEHYPHHEYTTEEWLKRRLAFKNGYRIAKETLYTEEQVMGFFEWHDKQTYLTINPKNMIEYLKSLKPQKKD